MSSPETATIFTADICDAWPERVRVCDLPFRDFGGRRAFHGRIATLLTHEDNVRLRALVETPGEGRVLVVDGAGSRGAALVGGNVAGLACDNGWAGLVVNGCVRDTHELADLALGIKALATCPRPPRRQELGEIDVPVSFGGVVFRPGAWLYADRDGVVVTDQQFAP